MTVIRKKKKDINFDDFKREVDGITRQELRSDLEDLTDVSEDVMREYWEKGQSPQAFFREQVETTNERPLDAYSDIPFDPRFEL